MTQTHPVLALFRRWQERRAARKHWGSLYSTYKRGIGAPAHDHPPLDGPSPIYMGDRA